MKIGVTGGTGLIGQCLIKNYGKVHTFIVVTSQKDCSKYSRYAKYVLVDYRNVEDYENAFRGCDAVILLGASIMKVMDFALKISNSPHVLSLESFEAAVKACKSMNIKNVVYASSQAVYDLSESIVAQEDSPCFPNSLYGVMKLAAEKIAEIYNRRYGMSIKTLRISHVIGHKQELALDSFWDKILYNSINNKTIEIYGTGTTGKDVIYVKDVCRALLRALEYPQIGGVFNVGTGKVCSNLEIAETYSEVFENQAGVVIDETKSESGIRTCLNCEKAKMELGFEAKYDIYGMVEDIKREYIQNEYNWEF